MVMQKIIKRQAKIFRIIRDIQMFTIQKRRLKEIIVFFILPKKFFTRNKVVPIHIRIFIMILINLFLKMLKFIESLFKINRKQEFILGRFENKLVPVFRS